MCTAFAFKGNDILYGYNLDVDPTVWDWRLVKKKDVFTVAIRVGSTTYYTHGVRSGGAFADLPYMNGEENGGFGTGRGQHRIDLLVDRYLRGKYSDPDVREIVKTREITNPRGGSMHSLFGNAAGDFLLVEPGYGAREIGDNHAVVTNFPILTELPDYSNPFYGKDRRDIAESVLAAAGADFSAGDGMELLREVCQSGQWGTRLSFVYSQNENAVLYCTDGDFERIEKWKFD